MRGTGPFQVVLISDPAINTDATDYSKFLAERDPSTLVLHEGELPTVYHCRPLTLQERRDVRNKSTDPDRYEAAFTRGLVRAERVWREADGTRIDWKREQDGKGKDRIVSDSDIASLFSEVAVQEIGAVIWHRSSLPFHPTSVVIYPLLDISRGALMVTKPPAAAPSPLADDKPRHEAQPQATSAT